MGVNGFLNLAKGLVSAAGALPQQLLQREPPQQQLPTTALEQVNDAVQAKKPQELIQLHAPSEIATATITPEVLQNAAPLAATNQQGIKPPAIKLEFSEEAVRSLKPILSALKDLVKNVLPELNLQQLAATAKPVLQALFQTGSNPVGTPSIAANPAQ